MIEKLREFQIGQYIREEGPKAHQKKAGTPTMGGVLICIAILLPTLLWSDLSNPFVWMVMGSTLAFGAIGFADDYIKVAHRRNLGLTAGRSWACRSSPAWRSRWCWSPCRHRASTPRSLMVPFLKRFHPDLSIHALGMIPHLGLLAFLPFVVLSRWSSSSRATL